MKAYLLIFSIPLIIFSAFAREQTKLTNLLPQKVQEIIQSKKDKKSILALLKKPDLIENNKYYFIVDKFKYGINLEFKDGSLSKMNYTIVDKKKRPALNLFNKFITKENLKLSNEDKAKFTGKYLELNLKKEKIKLRFKNTRSKPLYDITFSNTDVKELK